MAVTPPPGGGERRRFTPTIPPKRLPMEDARERAPPAPAQMQSPGVCPIHAHALIHSSYRPAGGHVCLC